MSKVGWLLREGTGYGTCRILLAWVNTSCTP